MTKSFLISEQENKQKYIPGRTQLERDAIECIKRRLRKESKETSK